MKIPKILLTFALVFSSFFPLAASVRTLDFQQKPHIGVHGNFSSDLHLGYQVYLIELQQSYIVIFVESPYRHPYQYEYGPNGQIISKIEAVEMPYGFQTKQRIDELVGDNDYDYGYRYYSAENARWWNQDPIGVAGGINLYNSVSNNMVNGFAGTGGFSSGMSREVGVLGSSSMVDSYGLYTGLSNSFPGSPWAPGGENYQPITPPSVIIDWAGAAIARRWILGWGNPWDIDNDPAWSNYMKAHKGLATRLSEKLLSHATVVASKRAKGKIDMNFHFDFDPGENVTGYEFLGGTNGGFDVWGSYETEKTKLGCRTVKYNLNYVWNDVIDPNRKYATDVWKSRLIKNITNTLLLKDPYDYLISIQYSEKSEITVDNDGNKLDSKGYPFNNSYPDGQSYDVLKNPSTSPFSRR